MIIAIVRKIAAKCHTQCCTWDRCCSCVPAIQKTQCKLGCLALLNTIQNTECKLQCPALLNMFRKQNTQCILQCLPLGNVFTIQSANTQSRIFFLHFFTYTTVAQLNFTSFISCYVIWLFPLCRLIFNGTKYWLFHKLSLWLFQSFLLRVFVIVVWSHAFDFLAFSRAG